MEDGRPTPPMADWLAQFGPRDVKPRRSESIILTFDFAKEDDECPDES